MAAPHSNDHQFDTDRPNGYGGENKVQWGMKKNVRSHQFSAYRSGGDEKRADNDPSSTPRVDRTIGRTEGASGDGETFHDDQPILKLVTQGKLDSRERERVEEDETLSYIVVLGYIYTL